MSVRGEIELWRIGDRLKRMGSGFSIAAREAGLNQEGVIASFLRAFPERFELNVPREGGKSTVKLLQFYNASRGLVDAI